MTPKQQPGDQKANPSAGGKSTRTFKPARPASRDAGRQQVEPAAPPARPFDRIAHIRALRGKYEREASPTESFLANRRVDEGEA